MEGPASEGRAVAGTAVWVSVSLRDRFGNETVSSSSDYTVAVMATGVKTITFEELEGDAFQYALSSDPVQYACTSVELCEQHVPLIDHWNLRIWLPSLSLR